MGGGPSSAEETRDGSGGGDLSEVGEKFLGVPERVGGEGPGPGSEGAPPSRAPPGGSPGLGPEASWRNAEERTRPGGRPEESAGSGDKDLENRNTRGGAWSRDSEPSTSPQWSVDQEGGGGTSPEDQDCHKGGASPPGDLSISAQGSGTHQRGGPDPRLTRVRKSPPICPECQRSDKGPIKTLNPGDACLSSF